MISCRTLGALEVLVDGAAPPPELRRQKLLALLLYLAHSPRGTRSKEHLISLLWPDAREPNQSLSQAQYLLRTEGDVGVSEASGQIRLDLKTVELDTTRLEGLVTHAKWAEASALVVGPFLDGFRVPRAPEFGDWVAVERDRWSGKCAEAMSKHAEELMAGGAQERALPVAERAAELLPHSDRVERLRVNALWLLGRRDEALDSHEHFRKRLKSDVDRAPEPATVELIARIREGRATRIAPRKKPEPKRRAPLVGRQRELKAVLECWARCREQGEAALTLVLGDPGCGKTRFLQEVVSRAHLDGAASAVIQAVPPDAAEPGSGLVALAEGGLLTAPGVASAPAPALAAFAARSSVWAERFPPRERGELPGLPRAFLEVVRGVASEKPVLLVVDDAQWVDVESLQALAALLRDPSRRPVLVILAASSDPPHAVPLDQIRAHMGRDHQGATVTLDLLGSEDLAALARWALPKYDAEQIERLARRVQADSGGLPLIAFELISGVASGLELRRGGRGAWPASRRTLYDTYPGDLPDAVVGAVRVNYSRLTADAQLALVAVAVIGARVPRMQVERATGLSGLGLDKALDELEWQRWLVAEKRGYTFLARIIRDLVLPMKTKGALARLRERAGLES